MAPRSTSTFIGKRRNAQYLRLQSETRDLGSVASSMAPAGPAADYTNLAACPPFLFAGSGEDLAL